MIDSTTRIREFIKRNFPSWKKIDLSQFSDADFDDKHTDIYRIENEEIICISYANISITGSDRVKPQLRVFLHEYKRPFAFAKKHFFRYFLFSIFTKEDEMARGLDRFNPKEYIISIETNLDVENSRRDLRSIYDYANERIGEKKILKCSNKNYKADINTATFVYIGTESNETKEYFNSFISVFDSRPYLNASDSNTSNTSFINIDIPLQVIYYGAPGTGKSYKIKNLEKGQDTKPVRTTFHPDSDYATFVGAYKPTMIDNNDGRPNRSYSIDELAELLKVAYQSSERKTLGVHSFVLTYAEQISGIYGKISIKDLVEKSGLPDGYQAMINDALNIYHYYIKQQPKDTKIAYKYIPQAFLKAYTQAWRHYPEPQYLVIEEINRGNCAQIFGDLFQLLDRSATGFSEYPIAADSDISKYLLETFATDDKFAPDESVRAEINELYKEEYTDVMADVRSGELLLLPKNLHILATMNTSDQSLFPIDSAFKRRWDWEYIPIRNANKGWVITASGKEWDWWIFLQCINEKIGSVTDSEDKKLGYFFVKPYDNHTISAETFVSKVVFYLWNDVFKDYGFNDKEFQTAGGAEMTFPMFYETDVEGQQVNEELVAQFLQNMVGEPLQDNSNEPATEEITGA